MSLFGGRAPDPNSPRGAKFKRLTCEEATRLMDVDMAPSDYRDSKKKQSKKPVPKDDLKPWHLTIEQATEIGDLEGPPPGYRYRRKSDGPWNGKN